MDPIEFPEHGRMSSIRMHLCHYRIQLPMAAAAKYQALTELVLFTASFEKDEPGGTVGAHSASSCPHAALGCVNSISSIPMACPSYCSAQKLLKFFKLTLQTLDVRAPNLRLLDLDHCFDEHNHVNEVARISAKRLEKIGMRDLARGCRNPTRYR